MITNEQLLEQAKKFIAYDSILSKTKDMIESLIQTEEGGWVLTDNKWDAGGWTYAGITHTVWNAHFPLLEKYQLTRDRLNALPAISAIAISIYYNDYCEPIAEHIYNSGLASAGILPPAFSCAVNLGVEGCKKILDQASNYTPKTFAWQLPSSLTVVPPRTAFLTCWMDHYVKLVQANPAKLVELGGAVHRVLKYCLAGENTPVLPAPNA
ncbi:unnamed protein product [Sphagnum jensenii]